MVKSEEPQVHTGSQEGELFLLVALTRKLRKAEAIPLGYTQLCSTSFGERSDNGSLVGTPPLGVGSPTVKALLVLANARDGWV